MISTKYKEAMAEVLCVLRNCDEQVIAKIPLEVIKNLKDNAIEVEGLEEKFEKYHDDISILNLSEETIAMLAAIYRKYLCTEEQREDFDKHLVNVEEVLQDSVDFENVFKEKQHSFQQNNTEQRLIDSTHKDNIFSKFIKSIRDLFIKRVK